MRPIRRFAVCCCFCFPLIAHGDTTAALEDLSQFTLQELLCNYEISRLLDEAWEAREAAALKSLEDPALKDHPWAGVYATRHKRLILSPEEGYVYGEWACAGRDGESFGSVTELDDGSLELKGALPSAFSFKLGEPFQVITWGRRRYLLQDREMIDFCNRVNSGKEPCDTTDPLISFNYHLLRKGDGLLPVSGLPALPAKYMDRLYPEPLCGTVTAVRPLEHKIFEVQIDLGSADGVRSGVDLYFLDPGPFSMWQPVYVGDVQAHSCVGETYIESQIVLNASPKVGWRVSSRYLYHFRDDPPCGWEPQSVVQSGNDAVNPDGE